MTYAPGQSGNPNGRPRGSRNKRTEKFFEELEARGDKDCADYLSSVVTNGQDEQLCIQAAGLLLPYKYSKRQPTPVPRYIEHPIEVPEFTSVEVAESFLAKLATLFAEGEQPLDVVESLTKMTFAWIQSQYAKQGIDLKAQAQGATDNKPLRIEASLAQLPGTNIIGFESYPVVSNDPINGYASAHQFLEHQTQNPSSIDGVHTDTTNGASVAPVIESTPVPDASPAEGDP